jgi:hypothetical protein
MHGRGLRHPYADQIVGQQVRPQLLCARPSRGFRESASPPATTPIPPCSRNATRRTADLPARHHRLPGRPRSGGTGSALPSSCHGRPRWHTPTLYPRTTTKAPRTAGSESPIPLFGSCAGDTPFGFRPCPPLSLGSFEQCP